MPPLRNILSSVKDCEEISASHVDEENKCSTAKVPLKSLTWNANGLLLRIKNNFSDLSKFLMNVDPDVIAIQDCGQPGFILSEKKRFGSILIEYGGKRMRIDYFVVSEKLSYRIVSCEMHGQGIELEGFYGSDIVPYLSSFLILLQLNFYQKLVFLSMH